MTNEIHYHYHYAKNSQNQHKHIFQGCKYDADCEKKHGLVGYHCKSIFMFGNHCAKK